MSLTLKHSMPPLSGHNAFRLNPLLLQIASGLDAQTLKDFDQIGHYALSAEAHELAFMANANPPVLNTHDRFGERIDSVDFHPAYHALMRRSVGYGITSSVWEDKARGTSFGHLKRAIRLFILSGVENGHLSSLSSTHGAVGALMRAPILANEWVPRVTTRQYDSAHRPPVDKSCLTFSLGVIEKAALTDLSLITTKAISVGNGLFKLDGAKWFLPSPMADAFLILATTIRGLTCFLVPRFLAGGKRNRIELTGIKNKLGNRSAATVEVKINGAVGQMIGREGEGAKIIDEMYTLMRLDSAIATAGIMHAALSEIIHFARYQKQGDIHFKDRPLILGVLADLAIDVAAATALVLRLARAYDNASNDASEGSYAHAMTPVIHFWITKLAPTILAEMIDINGACGHIENNALPRHYRDVASHLETGDSVNKTVDDACRIFHNTPGLFDKIALHIVDDLGDRGTQTFNVLNAAYALSSNEPSTARIFVEQLALGAGAGELIRLGTGVLADAFADTRLGGSWRYSHGMLDKRYDKVTILDALYPIVK